MTNDQDFLVRGDNFKNSAGQVTEVETYEWSHLRLGDFKMINHWDRCVAMRGRPRIDIINKF